MSDITILSKKRNIVELGTFDMVSGVARISDPCYDKSASRAGLIHNVLNGTWKAQVINKEETYTYPTQEWAKDKVFTDNRNVLIAVHESFNKSIHTDKRRIKTFSGGMDTGMAGIFDDILYQVDYAEDHLQTGRVEYRLKQNLFETKWNIPHLEAQLLISKSDKTKSQFIPVFQELLNDANAKLANPPLPDYSQAKPTRNWLDICHDRASLDVEAGVMRNGVVSGSGYGDGGYKVFAVYNTDNKVVGIKLIF